MPRQRPATGILHGEVQHAPSPRCPAKRLAPVRRYQQRSQPAETIGIHQTAVGKTEWQQVIFEHGGCGSVRFLRAKPHTVPNTKNF
jgi:hypothetical protein